MRLCSISENHLGRKVTGTIVIVPPSFTPAQKTALEKQLDARLHVLQLLEEAGTTVAMIAMEHDPSYQSNTISCRFRRVFSRTYPPSMTILHTSSNPHCLRLSPLISLNSVFFATDFTKKTKAPLKVWPAKSVADACAGAKLKLAIEHLRFPWCCHRLCRITGRWC